MLKMPVIDIPDTLMPHTTDNGTEVSVTKTEREIWKEHIKMCVKDERHVDPYIL